MGATTGLFHAVAIVMLISGASKWRDPAPFTSTWLALWGRPPRGTTRAVGAIEVVLGLAALSGRFGGALALVVAAAHVAFAVVVALAIGHGLPSCGCFGRRAAPPGKLHVVTNLASALVATIVGVTALRAG